MVDEIAQQRMADGLHMHADLMCPARLKPDHGQGTAVPVSQALIVRSGRLPGLFVDFPLYDGACRTGNRLIDHA